MMPTDDGQANLFGRGGPRRALSTGATARRGELATLVRSGVRWKVVSGVLVQITRVVTAILIARFVTPAEFGLAALVLVFSGLATILTDLALGSALIQRAVDYGG